MNIYEESLAHYFRVKSECEWTLDIWTELMNQNMWNNWYDE